MYTAQQFRVRNIISPILEERGPARLNNCLSGLTGVETRSDFKACTTGSPKTECYANPEPILRDFQVLHDIF